MSGSIKKISAAFYSSASGNEPVREWLLSLPAEDRRTIGHDIMTVEFGWPIGMPVCRSLGDGLWEVRSSLESGRIARVIFFIAHGEMVLLSGFIKKKQKTPPEELRLAESRRKEFER